MHSFLIHSAFAALRPESLMRSAARVFPLAVLVLMALASASATAQEEEHADIRPYVGSGRILTQGFVDPTSEVIPGQRVFGFDFGEDPEAPEFANDPGVNAAAGSGLTGGSILSLTALDGELLYLPSDLAFWNGSDADLVEPGIQPSFGPAPSGTTITLELESTKTISNTSGNQPGFVIQQVLASGAVHRHIASTLAASGTPADGIYVIPIKLEESDASIADSKSLFVVFNHGLAEGLHDAAIDYVTLNYAYELGDMDGDGDTDNFDIGPFELALARPDDYVALYPELAVSFDRRGDVSGNHTFDNFDISAFEQLLTSGSATSLSAVPEPGSCVLLAIGGAALLVISRRRSDPSLAGSQ